MDLTAQQAKVDDLKSQLATAQDSVSSIQTALTQAETELSEGQFINQVEGLTPDQITAANSAFAADGSKISIVVSP